MHALHHMSSTPSSGLSSFPAAVESRPRALSVAGADAVVREALSQIKDCRFKDDFLNRRWPLFLAEMQSRDQIWVFETSGYGAASAKASRWSAMAMCSPYWYCLMTSEPRYHPEKLTL